MGRNGRSEGCLVRELVLERLDMRIYYIHVYLFSVTIIIILSSV